MRSFAYGGLTFYCCFLSPLYEWRHSLEPLFTIAGIDYTELILKIYHESIIKDGAGGDWGGEGETGGEMLEGMRHNSCTINQFDDVMMVAAVWHRWKEARENLCKNINTFWNRK